MFIGILHFERNLRGDAEKRREQWRLGNLKYGMPTSTQG